MPVVVKVSDYGNAHTEISQARDDLWNRRRRFVIVDRDAHELRAGGGERGYLLRCSFSIGGIRVGHRLHDHRMRRANGDVTDESSDCLPALSC